jgi:transcriptional regulator with XRE-family HTH domain
MTESQGRTKLAQLRKVLGISAREFADLMGRSVDTVKSLESGRLALSRNLADDINFNLGVSMSWLLDEGVTGGPIDDNGQEPTADQMLARSAAVEAEIGSMTKKSARELYPLLMGEALTRILKNAAEHPDYYLAFYRTAKFFVKLEEEFVPSEKHSICNDDVVARWMIKKTKKAAGSSKRR